MKHVFEVVRGYYSYDRSVLARFDKEKDAKLFVDFYREHSPHDEGIDDEMHIDTTTIYEALEEHPLFQKLTKQ